MFCDCQAGIHGKLCKHKTGLLAGDFSKLFDKEDKDKLIQVQEFVSKTNYFDRLKTYNKVKADVEEVQKKEARIKAEIESAIKAGLELVHEQTVPCLDFRAVSRGSSSGRTPGSRHVRWDLPAGSGISRTGAWRSVFEGEAQCRRGDADLVPDGDAPRPRGQRGGRWRRPPTGEFTDFEIV